MPKGKFRKNKRQALIVFAAAIVLLLFLTTPLFSHFKRFSLKVFLFPVKVMSQVGKYFSSKDLLMEENQALRKRVADLSIEIVRSQDLKRENERLRGLLNFQNKFDFETVSAEIIARNPNDWLGSIVINKGSNDGVRINSAVCSANGLIGKIVDVNRDTSSVMLMTHPGFKAGGMIKDTRVNAIVVGGGKDALEMMYIPLEADVYKGSIVVTSGYSRIFPKGIKIGTIASVEKSKTGLYKHAVIKPSASSVGLEEVLCVK